MLKENGYKESIISKIFKIITSNYSLSQSQQQNQAGIQEEEIRMSLNLPYIEGTGVKLRQILKSMRNLLCKLKHRLATEDKNNIFYEIDCNN